MTQGFAMNKEQYEYLATQIFQASLEVHKTLGPGLLESVYEFALVKELQLRNINIQYQVKIPLFYKGHNTGKEFFIDILVEKGNSSRSKILRRRNASGSPGSTFIISEII